MSSEVAISVQSVSKVYTIYRKPEDRLKQMIFRGRCKYYSEFWAVKDVTLQIEHGETVALIGRNGSGKSTLLQLIAGVLTPTAGAIDINGRVGGMLELGAGFNPEFTGRENVYLAASILGLKQNEIEERFASIAAFAEIGDFIDQPVKLFSSGMYARLAFAVMAHVDADILIVDEILSVGDAAFAQKCMRFIREFRKRGALLFVSHDTSAVLGLCDRAIWLDAGEIRADGPAREVCHAYAAAIEREKDSAGSFRIGGSRKAIPVQLPLPDDHRAERIRLGGLSGRADVFEFDPEAPWYGQRGASIDHVRLLDPAGNVLSAFEGGEDVVLQVDCLAHSAVDRPIVGFYVKDRLGQNLFGDNTFLTYEHDQLTLTPGQKLQARFSFRVPYLMAGDYSVTIGLAAGTQEDHVQHHWADDVLFFRVSESRRAKGLIGIPMQNIELAVFP